MEMAVGQKALTSPTRIKEIFKKYHFHYRRKIGQNFLADANIVEKIVTAAQLTSDDVVVEIGPGFGVLTEKLVQKAGLVLAIEIDKRLLPILDETLKGFSNVQIVASDALKINFDALVAEVTAGEFGQEGKPYKLISNLPYYITTPIITKLLTNSFNFKIAVLMVQVEVAERIVAQAGGKDYGALSVFIQFYTNPVIVCRVSRSVFLPSPDVDSAVIKLVVREKPLVEVQSEKTFLTIVRAAFRQRRKMLLNALSDSSLEIPKEIWLEILKEAGIDPRRRGETLLVGEFAKIANTFYKMLSKNHF